MKKNVIGIISAFIAVGGLAFVSSWLCLFPLGVAFTMGVIGLFGGKGRDKMTPLVGMLVSVAGILVMCQFAGFIPTFGFKPIGVMMSGFFSSSISDINSREDALEYVEGIAGEAMDAVAEGLENSGLASGLTGLEGDSSELADGGGQQSSSSDGIDWSMKTDSESSGSGSIVGVWKQVVEGHMIVLNFYEGGTGLMQSDSFVAQLGWEQKGSNVKIDYYNDQGFVDESEECVVSIEGDNLRLTKPDGSVWSMERMSSLGQ